MSALKFSRFITLIGLIRFYVLGIGSTGAANADAVPMLEWNRQVVTGSDSLLDGIGVDSSGKIFVSGSKHFVEPYAGRYGGFLAKYDSAAALSWIREVQSEYGEYFSALAVDRSGNVYVCGSILQWHLAGLISFDYDATLAKYDSAGTLIWARKIASSPGDDQGRGIAVDENGNVYVTGWTNSGLGGSQQNYTDAFVLKYDAEGTQLWTREIGTSNVDAVSLSRSVAVDREGNAYVSGYTDGDVGGPYSGTGDAFLIKYDPTGRRLWARQVGHAEYNWPSVAVDDSGHAFMAFAGTAVKYDSAGALEWSSQIGNSPSESACYGIALDSSGNAYIAGNGLGTPGANANLIKIDSTGTLQWSYRSEVANYYAGLGVAVGDKGDIYLADSNGSLIKFAIPEPNASVLWGWGWGLLGVVKLRPMRRES